MESESIWQHFFIRVGRIIDRLYIRNSEFIFGNIIESYICAVCNVFQLLTSLFFIGYFSAAYDDFWWIMVDDIRILLNFFIRMQYLINGDCTYMKQQLMVSNFATACLWSVLFPLFAIRAKMEFLTLGICIMVCHFFTSVHLLHRLWSESYSVDDEVDLNELMVNQEEPVHYRPPEVLDPVGDVNANNVNQNESYIDEDLRLSQQLQQQENEIFDNQQFSNLRQEQDLLFAQLENEHFYQNIAETRPTDE